MCVAEILGLGYPPRHCCSMKSGVEILSLLDLGKLQMCLRREQPCHLGPGTRRLEAPSAPALASRALGSGGLGSLEVQTWEAQLALGPLCAPYPCPAGPPRFGGPPGCHSKAPQAEGVQTAETDPLPVLQAPAPPCPGGLGGLWAWTVSPPHLPFALVYLCALVSPVTA